MHLFPVDADDLPDDRKQYGFDNLDFNFRDYGVKTRENCVAMRRLPEYDISHIVTGQYILGEGRTWEGAFHPGE